MQVKSRILIALATTLLLAFILVFLFGPAFPFCPFILEFRCQNSERAEIYYHDSQYLNILDIDSMILETEASHGLKFSKKVQIVLTDSDAEFYRLTLNQFRFSTFPPFGRIIVSGRNKKDFEEGKIHIYTYLKHELSHALIFQNSEFIEYFRGNLPTWFLEGIATYYSNMSGVDVYPSFEAVETRMKAGIYVNPKYVNSGFLAPDSDEVRKLNIEVKWPFLYSEFALVIEKLNKYYGSDKLLRLINTIGKGQDFYTLFTAIYGMNFEQCWDIILEKMKSES
jgi:hypothetical protein